MNQRDMQNQLIIGFDGICVLCHGFVRFLIRIDQKKRFRFVSLQHEYVLHMIQDCNADKRLLQSLNTLVYFRNANAYVRFKAVRLILYDSGGVWRMLSMLLWLVPCFVGDRLYNIIAGIRYKLFGRYETCPLPKHSDKDRFIS
ncbi:DCC1-like thiol-disulfide oxidoreductase family protein [bacterium]|nr:DCC1-like thiol-disulfide oxidoreductase family protein [bacterium]